MSFAYPQLAGEKKIMCGIVRICYAAPTSGPGYVQGVDFWGTQTPRTALENSVYARGVPPLLAALFPALYTENRTASGQVGMTCNCAILYDHKESD